MAYNLERINLIHRDDIDGQDQAMGHVNRRIDGRSAAAMVIAVGASACGSTVIVTADPGEGDGGGEVALQGAGGGELGGSGGEGGEGGQSACAPTSVVATERWTHDLGTFGLWHNRVFGLIAGGAELALPHGYYDPRLTRFDAATGDELGTTWVEEHPLARDESGALELRGGNGSLELIDLASQTLVHFYGGVAWQPTVATMTGDGDRVVLLVCDAADQALVVRWTAGVLDQVVQVSMPCPKSGSDAVIAITQDGSRALVGLGAEPWLHHVDLERGTVQMVEAHDGGVVGMAFSPSEAVLATIGGDGALTRWRYPELTPLAPPLPAAVTTANQSCFCPFQFMAPIAWSPGGELFATGGEGGVVIRRSCDGEVLATVPLPEGELPSLLAFEGSVLAVATEWQVTMVDLEVSP